MNRTLFRRSVIGVVLAVGLVDWLLPKLPPSRPALEAETLATFTSGPDKITDLPCPNLDDNTGLPKPGTVCIGTWETGAGRFTRGALQGSSHYTYGWAFNSRGQFEGEFAESFHGRVAGCGSGRLVFRSTSLTKPDLSFVGHWEIVPGFGGGQLRNASGHGTFEGRIRADGTATGKTKGRITC